MDGAVIKYPEFGLKVRYSILNIYGTTNGNSDCSIRKRLEIKLYCTIRTHYLEHCRGFSPFMTDCNGSVACS